MPTSSLEANLSRYSRYQIARSLFFWLPVYFLYFTERVGLSGLLALQAIYFTGVVLLEIPSGYVSDRFGRRPVLLLSAALGAGAHLLFLVSTDFLPLAVAQILLSAAMAFNSGSDKSLLYDTLVALDRSEEYAQIESGVLSRAFFGGALAALVAGAVAGIDLRLAYGLSLGAQLFALATLWGMCEPPVATTRRGMASQVGACTNLFRTPPLGWCLLFFVAVTIANHVPYEFYAGYLDLLFTKIGPGTFNSSPLIIGIHLSLTMVVAGGASRLAVRLGNRLGIPITLLATLFLQTGIMLAMGLILHPAVAAFALLRSVPRAIQTPLFEGLVHPCVPSELRATFLSLVSLAGRLAFALTLLAATTLVGSQAQPDWATISLLLLLFSILAILSLLLLVWRRPRSLQSAPPPG